MKNYLLDTTYILPFFGISIKLEKIDTQLKEILNKYSDQFSVTTSSIIEAKWKAIREFQKSDKEEYLTRANSAILSLYSNNYFDIIDPLKIPEALDWADNLLVNGHKDIMDCWIAGCAKSRNLTLVTENKELVNKIQTLESWKDFQSISWKKLITKISKVNQSTLKNNNMSYEEIKKDRRDKDVVI